MECDTAGAKCLQVGGTCYFMAVMNFIARIESLITRYLQQCLELQGEQKQRIISVLDFAMEVTACRNVKVVGMMCKNLPLEVGRLYNKYLNMSIKPELTTEISNFTLDYSSEVIEAGRSEILLLCLLVDENEFSVFSDRQNKAFQAIFKQKKKGRKPRLKPKHPAIDTYELANGKNWLRPDTSMKSWYEYRDFEYFEQETDIIPDMSTGEFDNRLKAITLPEPYLDNIIADGMSRGYSEQEVNALIFSSTHKLTLKDHLDMSQRVFNVFTVSGLCNELSDLDRLLRKMLVYLCQVSKQECVFLGGVISISFDDGSEDSHSFSWNWCDTEQHYTLESIMKPIVICDSALQMCYRTDNNEDMANFANGKGYVYTPPNGVFSRLLRSVLPIKAEELSPSYQTSFIDEIIFVVGRKIV